MNKKPYSFFYSSGVITSDATVNKGTPLFCEEGRYWRERLLGICLALVAFGVYLWNLCPCVFPGSPALSCVSVLRAWPGHEMAGHPVWHIVCHLFSRLPFGELPSRLNLFSALCGAGAVYFLFRLVGLLLYDAMSEDRWMQQIEDDLRFELASKEGSSGGTGVEKINDTGHRIAMAGGAVSALTFAFCTPFWIASTSLYVQTFDVLLLLTTGYALTRYLTTASVFHLMAAMFLMGLGIFESPCFVLLFLGSLVLINITAHRNGDISLSFAMLLFLCLAGGFLLAGVMQVIWLAHGRVYASELLKISFLWFKSNSDEVRAMIVRKGWLIMLAQGLLPLLIVYMGRSFFVYTYLLSPSIEDAKELGDRPTGERQPHMSMLTWGIGLFILLACVAHALLNLPGSPWYFSKASTYLPIMPLLGIAITAGFLFSFSILFGHWHLPDPAKSTDVVLLRRPSRLVRLISAGMIVVLGSLIGASAIRNRGDLDGQEAGFVDLFCREILKVAPEARCFVTDGTFDMNLRMQAWISERKITVLNLRESHSWIASPPGKKDAKKPTATFIIEWLGANPAECSQVAVLTAPRLWFDAGFQAIPSILVYLGAKPDAKLTLPAMVNEHRLFWEKNRSLLTKVFPRSVLLSNVQAEMRAYVSRITNDLGVLCLHQDARTEARDAFSLAVETDPDNLCAWVNQCASEEDVLETTKGASFDALLKRITVAAQKSPSFNTLTEYEKRYGALWPPAVEHLANRCNSGGDANKKDQRSRVLQLARDYVLASIRSNAEPRVSKQSLLKDGSIDEDVLKVVEAITGGYLKAAESQLRNLLRIRRASLVAWSLLAEVLMGQGNFAEVQNTVLPEMRFIAGSKGSEWIEMTEGSLAMRQEKPDYQLSHDLFKCALQRKPDMEEAQNLLIQTALSLGDQAQIETDCKAVLTHSRHQPMANAALGVLLLNQGRLEDAEKALNISIAARPSSLALNDLGETLRRMQRLKAAEVATRRALLLQPEFYQAWDTLALILADQKRLDEAAEAHRAALRLCQTDIRLYLSAAQLEQLRGDFNAVRKILREAAPLLEHSSTPYKKRYEELAKSLPR